MDQSSTHSSPIAGQAPYQDHRPPKRIEAARRSYAERSGEHEDLDSPPSSPSIPGNPLGIVSDLDGPSQYDTASPNTIKQQSLTVDPDLPPANVRAKPWSPDPPSPTLDSSPIIGVATTGIVRRGSVPEKSPLQKLEAGLVSKEQKRAKLVDAEDQVRQNGVNGTNKRRDSTREPTQQNRNGKVYTVTPLYQDTEPESQHFESSPTIPVTPTSRGPLAADGTNNLRGHDRGAYAVRGIAPALLSSTPALSVDNDAAARGKAAHERRKQQSLMQSAQLRAAVPAVTSIPVRSKARNSVPSDQTQTDTRGQGGQKNEEAGPQIPARNDAARKDAISKKQVQTSPSNPVNYTIPPQVISAQQARHQVGFGTEDATPSTQTRHHHFGGLLHRNEVKPLPPRPEERPLDEWRSAEVARLRQSDLISTTSTKQKRPGTSRGPEFDTGSSSRGGYEETAKQYRPQLFTKCGPLLRYTGIRREDTAAGMVQVWRGSIMVVTEDAQSDCSTPPSLRLFAHPTDLYVPGAHLHSSSEVDDPIAGQVKLSRTGRPLFVRPVEDIASGVDLSREENPRGLYTATRTLSQAQDNHDDQIAHSSLQSRLHRTSGEQEGRHAEVKGFRLHAERGWTFWRFNIEIELGSQQARIAYRLNNGPAIGFWVPAQGETMNVMFHSCNGFSLSVDPDEFSGPDPLWRDVLNRHQADPFHVMIGGGDQIYNDAAMRDTELFRGWLLTKNRDVKYNTSFTPDLKEELETFYLERYAMWFSQGLFAMANSQIPMVNIWDDHDIIDGFGSYPHHFMSSPVFTGLGAVAFKYYMLFQHQSLVDETEKEEPSWLLGSSRGPYINQLSRSVFLNLGQNVAFLGLDCRTERMRDEILSADSYQIIFNRCRKELVKGQTRHLIVLLGVPIAYPRLNFLENILTSRAMDPIKALGRTGMLGGFVNKFDGGVEVLDDLDDHWTAKHHKAERNWFIEALQELAAEYSVRITILGGDVHLAAVGQFFTAKKFNVPKDQDHRYMPNIISSAIVNTPPPSMMADVLNKRDKIHHLDHETDENLIAMFSADVDGTPRNNKRLLPRRNYCTIREFKPSGTPPPSPRLGPKSRENDDTTTRPQPHGIRRTMSLTRNPAVDLVRRLSTTHRSKNPPVSINRSVSAGNPGIRRTNSLGDPVPSGLQSHPPEFPKISPEEFRPSFHRRPTDLSDKQIRRASATRADGREEDDGREAGHINLEFGLDVSLNVEIDQKDPSGHTKPYRILVPALWYKGTPDLNTLHLKTRRIGLVQRLASVRGRKQDHDQIQDRPQSASLNSKDEISSTVPGAESARPSTEQEQPSIIGRGEHQTSSNANHATWKRSYGPAAESYDSASDDSEYRNDGRYTDRHDNVRHDEDKRSPSPQSFISGDDLDITPRPSVVAMRQRQKADKFFGIKPDDGAIEGLKEQRQTAGPPRRHVSLQEQPTTFVYEAPPRRRGSWKIWQR